MTSLQALVTGMLAGSLVKQENLDIEVTILLDEKRNYTNQILVTGRQSGEKLIVTVASVT